MVVGFQRHAPAALPVGMTPGTRTGGWVGLLGRRVKSSAHWNSIPGPSSPY
jgi:hypothetical protein